MEHATFTLREQYDADTFAGTIGAFDVGALLKAGGGKIETDDPDLIRALRGNTAFALVSAISTNLPDLRVGQNTAGAPASASTTTSATDAPVKPAARRRRRTASDDKE